jgi:hypothetical protein
LLARGEDAFKLFQKDSGAFQMVSFFSSAGAAPFFFLLFTLNILNYFLEQGGYNLLLLVNLYGTWVEFV